MKRAYPNTSLGVWTKGDWDYEISKARKHWPNMIEEDKKYTIARLVMKAPEVSCQQSYQKI